MPYYLNSQVLALRPNRACLLRPETLVELPVANMQLGASPSMPHESWKGASGLAKQGAIYAPEPWQGASCLANQSPICGNESWQGARCPANSDPFYAHESWQGAGCPAD